MLDFGFGRISPLIMTNFILIHYSYSYTIHKIFLDFLKFFLFMSDTHHGINSSTQKYQST